MDHLTNRTVHLKSAWLEIATDVYLDQRHRNWVLAEELGDVVFVTARGVVLVDHDRAEHIARAFGWCPEAAVREQAFLLPAMTTPLAPSPGIGTAAKAPIVIVNARSRWLAACGWLGIVAGATVFVAALVLPLDDPALVVALMLAPRGGQFAVTA